MRTKFFAIAALVLGLASCQKDFAPEVNSGAEVDFQLSVSAPELGVTRAGDKGEIDTNSGMNSAFGAIDYLDGAVIGDDRDDWTDVDLRYSLEVYDATDDFSKGDAKPIKDRQVRITDKYEPVTFELRLVPGRNYRFVVFADFVDQGTSEDDAITLQNGYGLRHTINGNLQNITFKEDKINDELADAYFKWFEFTPDNNTNNRTDAILTRPYAKVRVVATDFADLNLNIDPATVEVIYHQTHPTTFNAVTGEIGAFTQQESVPYSPPYRAGVSNKDLSNHFYTAGYDSIDEYWTVNAKGEERHSHMTLFTDYILAKDDQEAISFKMVVKDAQGEDIKVTDFNTTIPVQRNHLTTIIGNVLTTATNVDIQINDNFANDDEGNSLERVLLETLINGGKFALYDDMKLTAPHFLKGTIECRADAVIDLNGHTLTYEIPSDVTTEEANKYAIFVRVMENASLTFVGDGKVVSDGYIASVNEGGVLNVSEGIFESNSCTLFQSNGGEINIFGGEFKAAEYNGDHRYTVNFIDSKKQDGLIEISGGKFFKYNPEESLSENPAMNFCAPGSTTVENGDWFEVVPSKNIIINGDKAEIYSADGLLTWANALLDGASIIDDNGDELVGSHDIVIASNVKLPKKAIVLNNGKYEFSDQAITIDANGIPSASNWPEISTYENANGVYTDVKIDGNGKTISGLCLNHDLVASGFLCWTKDAEIKNLTFDNAHVYNKGGNAGESYTGVAIGRCWDGSDVINVHVKNSTVVGEREVGAIVGRLYHRTEKANGEWLGEKMAYVINCTVDENTLVKGDHNVGGIVGMNYGCVVGNCVSNATVEGTTQVGGIAGAHQSYYKKTDAFIIGCVVSDKAKLTVTGANGEVGGIAGYTRRDNSSHTNTRVWIIGCTTEAQLSGANRGSFVGDCVKNNGVYGSCITASYAVTNLTKFAAAGNPQVEAAYNVANVSELSQTEIDAMNAAIEAFNVSPDNVYVNGEEGAKMLKRWTLTANGPVLQ